MLDIVVIAYAKTIPLLKLYIESFNRFYSGNGQLHIFSEKECYSEIKSILRSSQQLTRKEEVLPDHSRYNGYLTQQYFKLQAHRFVSHPFYIVHDDDYLFIRETKEEAFFPYEQKPAWFFQTWDRAGGASRWKNTADEFLGFKAPYCFITTPAFVLKNEILKSLSTDYDLNRILTSDGMAEFQLYGSYAFHKFPTSYHWVDGFWGDEVFGSRINQPPPNFLTLDPTIQVKNYSPLNYVQFWSHWSQAEQKMREFLGGDR